MVRGIRTRTWRRWWRRPGVGAGRSGRRRLPPPGGGGGGGAAAGRLQKPRPTSAAAERSRYRIRHSCIPTAYKTRDSNSRRLLLLFMLWRRVAQA
eukprot:35962-Prorocentrum_minimum.AAC.3